MLPTIQGVGLLGGVGYGFAALDINAPAVANGRMALGRVVGAVTTALGLVHPGCG